MFKAALTALALCAAYPAFAFEIAFTWDGLELCTTGYPNTVDNPRFDLKDVPDGTAFLRFKLVDTDVPEFDHGGGLVAYTGQTTIEPGAFTYQSPCPPDGSHRYEWTATALTSETDGDLATAKAARDYPE